MTYEELLAERGGKLHVLGPDHAYQWFTMHGHSERAGIILWHRAQDGQACGGACHIIEQPGRGKWTVVVEDPLTLSPSIQCKGQHGCGGTHGHIRGGRWEPA